MTENYRQSALRHYTDAELLAAAARYDNAGHLIGFAAECAVKLVLSAGSPVPRESKIHLPDLAQVALKNIQSRNPLQMPLFSVLQGTKGRFFDDWRVSSRYNADGHVARETYSKWKRMTERVLGAARIRRP